MKLLICESCASQATLCPSCQARLSSGEISELDVTISRLLYKYREHFGLEKVELLHAINLGKFVVLITASDAGLLIGKRGRVINALSKELGRKLRVVQQSANMRRMIEELLLPARIAGLNILYTKEGERYRLRIPGSEASNLPTDVVSLQLALKKLTGQDVAIVFE